MPGGRLSRLVERGHGSQARGDRVSRREDQEGREEA